MDRVNISIAAPFIMLHYGWSESQMGIIFSAFFVGYVIFMIPGGIIADRYGPRKVLTGCVTF
jgi:MFS family permease